MKKLLILNYHRLVDFVDSPSKLENLFNVRRKDFIFQLELLEKNNIPVVSLKDAMEGNLDAPLSVVITFDDGNSSDLGIATKILNAYKYPATFFPSVQNIQNGTISKESILEISNNGMEIGSHGLSHTNFKDLTRHEQFLQLSESKRFLENIINGEINHFSVPHGLFNNKTIDVAKEIGYKSVLTDQFKINSGESFVFHRWAIKNSTTLPEFEKIIRRKKFSTIKKSVFARLRTNLKNVVGINTDNTISVGLARIQASPSDG